MTNDSIRLEKYVDERKNIILEERLKYLNDGGISYSWSEVKKAALDKRFREELLHDRVERPSGFQ